MIPYKKRANLGLCALAAAITLAGCAGLPDQRLANEALKRGDTALAERNYKALADLGYSEAQVGLADIKVATRDPSQIKEAEATYRAAAATSPRAQARLGRLLVAKPDSTQAEREEAETLLKQAAKQGESNTLIPLAMLYLSYPQSFPRSTRSSRSTSGAPPATPKRAWPRCCCTAPRAPTTSTWATWKRSARPR